MAIDVILTGADTRQCMVTIRSLARRGIKMLVTGEAADSIGFRSKYISAHAHSPSPMTQKREFVEFHIDLARRHGVSHIFPVTESSLIPLSEAREEVAQVAELIAPSSQTVQAALDKKQTLKIAEQHGVPISQTLYPDTIEEALEAGERWGYPVIFKPRGQSNIAGLPSHFDFKVFYAQSAREAAEFLKPFEGRALPMMQDFSYGKHIQFNCFMEHGEAHSYFSDEAIRTLPLTGGVGATMRSRALVPELARNAIKLFKAMNWEGCGQAQFKGPGKDGSYRFIEVSVRLPASVGSAVFSGVDTPWMQYCYFTGRPVERAESYRVGQVTRWLRGDTLTVLRYLLNDMQEPVDPLPSKADVLKDYLLSFSRRDVRYYIENSQDPVPGLIELQRTVGDVRTVLKRSLHRGLPSGLKPRP